MKTKVYLRSWSKKSKHRTHQFNNTSIFDEDSEFIARGNLQNYGDCAFSLNSLETSNLNQIKNYNKVLGTIYCQSGVTIEQVLEYITIDQWTLAAVPGSPLVTIGGAIASDVHGKDHHINGSFCNHIEYIDLEISKGKILQISKNKFTDLFHATCAGYGLTGLIIGAQINLYKINSLTISQKSTSINSLNLLMTKFNLSDKLFNYAWIDSRLMSNGHFKAILFESSFQTDKDETKNTNTYFKHNKDEFWSLINPFTLPFFNFIYFSYHLLFKIKSLSIFSSYFPLQRLINLNQSIGDRKIIQLHFCADELQFKIIFSQIAKILKENSITPILINMKKFSSNNQNYLSFAKKGFSLSIDFIDDFKLTETFFKMHEIIVQNNGHIYLAKDSQLTTDLFQRIYPKWDQFKLLRAKYYITEKLKSDMAQRLGIL